MSLTIITQPQPIELAATPKQLRLITNNLYQAVGAFSHYRITINGIPTGPNQDILFSWADNNVVLTTKAAPDNSGYQYSYVWGTTNAYDWGVAHFIPAIKGNYLLNRDFDVQEMASPPGTIILDLTARQKGPEYSLTVDYYTLPSGHISGTLAVPGVAQVIHPNFQSYVELYISRSTLNDYKMVQLTQTHSGLESVFPLHQILSKDYYGSTLPDYGASALKNISNAIIKYYLKYAESYGEPKAVQKLSITDTKFCINGGQSKDGAALQNFYAQVESDLKTLLILQDSLRVSTRQPQFLNYLHAQDGVTSFKVYADVYYTDGTQDPFTLYNQASAVAYPSLWVIPAGYNIIAPLANVAKTVSSYRVWVGNTAIRSSQYSQVISFNIDTRPEVEETHFLYKNSLGVFQVYRSTGFVNRQVATKKETTQRHLAPDYAVTDAATITTSATWQGQLEVNTGWQSKAEMLHFIDFLLSPQVYHIGSYFRPVNILDVEGLLAATQSGRKNEITFIAQDDTLNTHYTHV